MDFDLQDPTIPTNPEPPNLDLRLCCTLNPKPCTGVARVELFEPLAGPDHSSVSWGYIGIYRDNGKENGSYYLGERKRGRK